MGLERINTEHDSVMVKSQGVLKSSAHMRPAGISCYADGSSNKLLCVFLIHVSQLKPYISCRILWAHQLLMIVNLGAKSI